MDSMISSLFDLNLLKSLLPPHSRALGWISDKRQANVTEVLLGT
jgi:hypothetical protein